MLRSILAALALAQAPGDTILQRMRAPAELGRDTIDVWKDQNPWVISKLRRIMKSWRFKPATRDGQPVAHWRQDMLETASSGGSGP